jgi:hypothetical protein
MRNIFVAGLLSLPMLAQAVSMDALCTYAPSQSKVVAAMTGAAGVSPVTLPALAAALGLTVVPHSSGAAILTGSSGYIAGTFGVAAVGPAIVTVSLVVGGSAVALELVCVPRNHPTAKARLDDAAAEFGRRYQAAMREAGSSVDRARKGAAPVIERASANVTRTAKDVFDYASRTSTAVRKTLPV